MKILILASVVALFSSFSSIGHAEEAYLCEEATGFAFQHEKSAWRQIPVEASGSYRVVRSRRQGTAWEVTLQDVDLTVLCENDLGPDGWTRCDGLFTFVFRDKGSFMAIHDVPYTLEVMGKAKVGKYIPYIVAGECKRL